MTIPYTFESGTQVTKETWEQWYTSAIEKVKANIPTFFDGYPAPASIHNVYPKLKNVEWTSSFWNGMLYLAYLHTKDEVFLNASTKTLADYKNRIENRINTNTHDLGFLYILSCKAQYLITGNREARSVALQAADLLMTRYHEKAGIIQAWGDLEDQQQRGRIIIDCLMNVPLLFWAAEESGNTHYKEAAIRHIAQTRKYLIREDDTTFHTYYFDTETGSPLKGVTAQGFSDDSCWARGQAWGIYGLALAYLYTKDEGCLVDAKRLANYFLAHLPYDHISYWDLIFTEGKEERDSSASAIASCGLLLIAKILGPTDKDFLRYESAAYSMLRSLSESYTSKENPHANGILLHAVYGKPDNSGVDECTIWGDYFYMEALGTVLGSAIRFW